MTKNTLFKIAILAIIGICIFLIFKFNLTQYLTLEELKSQQARLASFNQENPWLTALGFFIVYVVVTSLSLPGAAILTIAGGAIFGLFYGLIIISFASTLGATIAFLIARFLMRDQLESKFSSSLDKINDGIQKDGAFYLFGLRLVPIFPFFVINLVMGLTRIKTTTYAWVSQLGMLPGTAVFVNAGQQLNQIESLKDITSPSLLISFALLGIFPIIAKWILSKLKQYRTSA